MGRDRPTQPPSATETVPRLLDGQEPGSLQDGPCQAPVWRGLRWAEGGRRAAVPEGTLGGTGVLEGQGLQREGPARGTERLCVWKRSEVGVRPGCGGPCAFYILLAEQGGQPPTLGPSKPDAAAGGTGSGGDGRGVTCCRPPPCPGLLQPDSRQVLCVCTARGSCPRAGEVLLGPRLRRGLSFGHGPPSGCTNSHSGPADPQAHHPRDLSKGTGCRWAMGGTVESRGGNSGPEDPGGVRDHPLYLALSKGRGSPSTPRPYPLWFCLYWTPRKRNYTARILFRASFI